MEDDLEVYKLPYDTYLRMHIMSSNTNSIIEKITLDRFAFIDTLRGLAALYVCLYHLALLPNPDLDVPYWAKQIVLTGATGVTLFFVVSAFTLCYSMQARSDSPNPIYEFYVRRIFRIVPLFYLWIIISLIRDAYILGVKHSFADTLLSTFFVFNFIPGKQGGFVWASWTLGVEMLFYLVFPLIFRSITDYRRALAFFIVAIVVARAFQYLLVYIPMSEAQRSNYYQFSFLHQLPVFAAGVLFFFLYKAFVKGKEVNHSWGIILLAMFLFIYDALLSGKLKNILLDGLYWQAIAYGCLLLGLSIFPWKLIVNKFTGFLGLISYSVYLSHTTVIVAFRPLYLKLYSLEIPTTFQFFFSAFITVAIVILISYISYKMIEKPGINLGRSLIRKKNATVYQANTVSIIETKLPENPPSPE
jgi:peptidoglycan/LPS O-acetylase OafA/YrhL